MKLNEIRELKIKLEKAESIQNSINEIDKTLGLFKELSSKITKIGMSYATLEIPKYSVSGEEEYVDIHKEITPGSIGVRDEAFSTYFKESVIIGLTGIKEALVKELEEL